jgi:UDP-glucose 4-epimerase
MHDAVLKVKPDAKLQIQDGKGPRYRENAYMDISRLSGELGYKPKYTPESGMADYIAWLEAGNEK